jgi:hypothetical protein
MQNLFIIPKRVKHTARAIVFSGGLAMAAGGATFAAPVPAQAQKPICGLVVYHTQGSRGTVYKGVAFGTIIVVTSENGRVLTTIAIAIRPGGLVVLHPDQSFACHS